MNKGMKFSNGKFICMVNCGDTLTKNSLKIINKYLKKILQMTLSLVV